MGRSQGRTNATGTGTQPGPETAPRRRAALIALAAAIALTALAAGTWWVTLRLATGEPDGTRQAELALLGDRLEAVNAALTPIATAFTSEPASEPIDVAAYRARIASARRLVDEVNGVEVSDADALQVRDLIVTGGSQVLDGMDLALDALVSDDASATGPADLQVGQGLETLQQARTLLDTLTGRSAPARLPDRSDTAETAA